MCGGNHKDGIVEIIHLQETLFEYRSTHIERELVSKNLYIPEGINAAKAHAIALS
jgi:hypothetical protein